MPHIMMYILIFLAGVIMSGMIRKFVPVLPHVGA